MDTAGLISSGGVSLARDARKDADKLGVTRSWGSAVQEQHCPFQCWIMTCIAGRSIVVVAVIFLGARDGTINGMWIQS